MTEAISKYKKVIMKKLHQVRDHMSLVEVERAIEAAGLEVHGNHAMEHPRCPNLIMWVGMSKGLFDALNGLFQEKAIHWESCKSGILVYVIDGGMPKLPVAKRPPRSGYKKPHWLPVTLRPGAAPEESL